MTKVSNRSLLMKLASQTSFPLSEQDIDRIVSLLEESTPLPEDYKTILFDTKKEYELVYAGKEREV